MSRWYSERKRVSPSQSPCPSGPSARNKPSGAETAKKRSSLTMTRSITGSGSPRGTDCLLGRLRSSGHERRVVGVRGLFVKEDGHDVRARGVLQVGDDAAKHGRQTRVGFYWRAHFTSGRLNMDYPRPNFRRSRWISLDGEWEFGAGDTETFDRKIVVPFCPQSSLSSIGDPSPGDVVWYRRRFDAPDAARLLLHFGAVDYRATVWVNGEEVAHHEGGHTPFSADLSRLAGRRNNILVVRAQDPLDDKTIPRGKQHWTATPEGIFYTATIGIWQTVWLEPLPLRSIQGLTVTPDLDRGAVTVEVDAEGDVELTATFDGQGVGRRKGSGVMALDQVFAWSPESPNLYHLQAILLDARGLEIDRVDSHFGLRKIEARDGRFWLNGAPYIQRLVLDQGYFPGGLMTAPSGADLRRDIELAKAMGFNGARKHQKVEDPRWLDWADRLGFLVWGEMASVREHSSTSERRFK